MTLYQLFVDYWCCWILNDEISKHYSYLTKIWGIHVFQIEDTSCMACDVLILPLQIKCRSCATIHLILQFSSQSVKCRPHFYHISDLVILMWVTLLWNDHVINEHTIRFSSSLSVLPQLIWSIHAQVSIFHGPWNLMIISIKLRLNTGRRRSTLTFFVFELILNWAHTSSYTTLRRRKLQVIQLTQLRPDHCLVQSECAMCIHRALGGTWV